MRVKTSHRYLQYRNKLSEIPCRVNRKDLAHDSYIGEAFFVRAGQNGNTEGSLE